jgi:hypothetical protein
MRKLRDIATTKEKTNNIKYLSILCVNVPIGDTLFAEIAYFAPSIVLEVDKRNYSLQRICDNYGHLINSNALCFEWRNVSFLFDEEKKKHF